jgi:hypothetical protein
LASGKLSQNDAPTKNAGVARAGSVTPGGLVLERMSEGIRGGRIELAPGVSVAGRGTLFERSIDDVDILGWLLGPVAAASPDLGQAA